jgi:uncharacterized protein
MSDSETVVERFFAAQRVMYTGAPVEPLLEMLHEDIVWHVPGASPIAGDHTGRDAVIDYFRHRRALTGATLEISDRGGIAIGDTVIRLADGKATIAGAPAAWRTAGIYRVADGRLREVWLVPLDLDEFERAWAR